jgi:chemotaxis protein MotC
LEPDARRDLYLMAARSSIEQGLTISARMLAEKAQELSEHDKGSAARAKLYRAAATIVLPEKIVDSVAELRSIDRSLLGANDLALLDSALAMADQIRLEPGKQSPQVAEVKPTPHKGASEEPAKALDTMQGSEQLQALSKAREALSRVDKLIKNQATVTQ